LWTGQQLLQNINGNNTNTVSREREICWEDMKDHVMVEIAGEKTEPIFFAE
jgi:hypothetical protein